MAINYAWVCHFCGHSNLPGRSSCESCASPAIASAKDIARFRGENRKAEVPVSEGGAAKFHLPRAPKIVAGFLFVIAFAGAILERFAWSMTVEFIAIGLLVGAGLPAWLIVKAYERPATEKNDT